MLKKSVVVAITEYLNVVKTNFVTLKVKSIKVSNPIGMASGIYCYLKPLTKMKKQGSKKS